MDPLFLSLSDEHEERIAIAEYDGCQDTLQAQRIAYQDAFIAVLNTLAPGDTERVMKKDCWIKSLLRFVLDAGRHAR